jgi:hypothetical protein
MPEHFLTIHPPAGQAPMPDRFLTTPAAWEMPLLSYEQVKLF